ncbi:uncharacterized protein JCM6883_006603 [Sporobolomyces salmoneus]|uniref:uncharacterized protein n=1 Tax=Sporobolomyces salmoneus TaxID=183962 RepID=UPI003178050E
MFQFRLFHTPVANVVTHLILDANAKLDTISTTLFHIAPKLPNLSTITIESIDFFVPSLYDPSSENEQRRMNLSQLVELGKTVTSWNLKDLSMLDELERLLQANLSNIKSISLVAPSDLPDGTALPGFLSLISSCTSLSDLSIHIPGWHAYMEPEWIVSLDSFSFANRLTSLSVSIGLDETIEGYLNDTTLEFASFFPSLVRLKLSANDTSFSSAKTPSDPTLSVPRRLPTLKYLILHLPTPTTMLETLEHLELPALEHLQIVTPLDSDHYSVAQSLGRTKIPLLARRIHSMEESLRLVELFSQRKSALDRFEELFHYLRAEMYSKQREKSETAEFVWTYEVKNHYESIDSEEYSKPPVVTKPTIIGPLTEQEDNAMGYQLAKRDSWMYGKEEDILSLTTWLMGRVQVLAKEESVDEMHRMWRSLADLNEYSRWMRD